MKIATSGIFLYNDKYYKQVDGVSMGSPLGPTIANFCLAHYEKTLLDSSSSSCKPALYLRYVDDVFCVFRDDTCHEEFLGLLNNMHTNLRFTAEVGQSSLAFLDTYISLPKSETESFSSRVFRKKTYTGLLLNYSAMCPSKWKFGLIQCLLHRAYMISSDWATMSREIDFLKETFLKNGYPERLFSTCVRNFLNRKCSDICNEHIREDSVETIFCKPYIGLPSIIFGRKLKAVFKTNYGISIRVVYSTFKISHYFSLKCKTPMHLLANVIYQYNCLCDTSTTYIGKTKRHLAIRVKEHKQSQSAIRDHLQTCMSCNKNFSSKAFSIIDTGRNDFEITIKEALHIKNKKPTLNKQLYSQGASFVLNIF